MLFLSEALMLLTLFTFYLGNRSRRKYLKERIGRKAILNVYTVARNIGFMLARICLVVQGDERILEKGGIMYSFHFGVWECMPAQMGRMGYNLAVLVNTYDSNGELGKVMDRILQHFRAAASVRIFTKKDTLKIIDFLKTGGILGVLVDGNDFYSKFEKIKKLSRICQVPLIPFAAYRNNNHGILNIGCDLDNIVAQRPLDYVWFYRSRAA